MDYVLISAVRNEANYIGNTIQSVIHQSALPKAWIIVSDGSTDRTDEIVLQYAAQNDFISLVRKEANLNGQVDFSSKVRAIILGHENLAETKYDFIGILDGDVTFDSYYYENVLRQFAQNSKLGIAGGIILDQYSDHQIRRSPANANYVSGCIQLFRRQCYEDVGGLHPIKEGGEDTIATIIAQMKGWKVEAFEELKVLHHKHSNTMRGRLKGTFREGRMFYAVGSHPAFEILKGIQRVNHKPILLDSLARLLGYFLSFLQGQQRSVSPEFIRFLRQQQRAKLKNFFIPNRRNGHD